MEDHSMRVGLDLKDLVPAPASQRLSAAPKEKLHGHPMSALAIAVKVLSSSDGNCLEMGGT
ncbi:MAG: hypothetical protein OXB95_13325 [Rhodobacteraceae bacterium]|nr:hypothetical protein [Paracoccaceae bacterium]